MFSGIIEKICNVQKIDLSGHDIYWSAGIVPLVAYTFGVLIVGAGIRAVLKG